MKCCLLVLILVLFSLPADAFSQTTPKKITWLGENDCIVKNLADNEKPQCDLIVRDDKVIKVIRFNDITIAGTPTDDGDYFILDLIVINEGKDKILADPDNSKMLVWMDDKAQEKPEMFDRLPPDSIAKKIKNRMAWANVFGAIAAGMARQTATVTTTDQSGAITNSTVTLRDQNAQNVEANRAQTRNAQAGAQGANVVANAFKANTLFEKQYESGFIYFKRKKKASIGSFVFRINDVYFYFPFNAK